MSMNAELEGIYKRLKDLEDVSQARYYIIQGLLITLKATNPTVYRGMKEGMENGLEEWKAQENPNTTMITEVERFLQELSSR